MVTDRQLANLRPIRSREEATETLEVREEVKNPYETLTTEQLLKLVAMGDDKEREEEQR